MNEKFKAGLALTVFLSLVTGLQLMVGYGFYSALDPDDRRRLTAMLAGQPELLLELGLLELGLLGIAFILAYQIYVRGSLKIAEGVRIILGANPAHRLVSAGPAQLRAIAHAVNALADHSETLTRDLETRIAEAKSSVEEEKNRLAALMSELSQGVLVCTLDGQILLYNDRARQALCDSPNPPSGCPAPLIGLGRSIFGVLDRSRLAHAVASIEARLAKNEADPNAQFLITTRVGQQVRVRMAPVRGTAPDTSAITGLVLLLENITRAFGRDATRDMLLQSFTEGSRAAVANLRAAAETLTRYPDCSHRDRFLQVINEEACRLSGQIDRIAADHADSLKAGWPLEEMLGVDLIMAARRWIENRLGPDTDAGTLDDALWLKVDSYALVQAFGYLAERLRDGCGVRKIRFDLTRRGRIAELDLSWPEPALSLQTWGDWETGQLSVGGEDRSLTLREVMDRHGAEMVYMVDPDGQWFRFRLLLPVAQPAHITPGTVRRAGESRPEFYDFDLFNQTGQTPELDQALLTELNYTVFDTETTGLDPSAGDEIISIGAVRIVNNRLLHYETYEQLIDPKRPMSSPAELIHGISNQMLHGQPTIDHALPQFHEYCADPVLIGHNAAFDLRFLQLKEAQTGIRFTQPVLDTLLLSHVLHPRQESHALEAIAERLGVAVVARHTALGDALVTGEIFLRMIPLLAAHGIHTLGEARKAAEQIYAGAY